MKVDRIVLGIASFALFFGLGSLAVGLSPHSAYHTITIPSGDYYHLAFSYAFGAPVSATYEVTSGGAARVYLMSDSQFSAFASTGTLSDLAFSNATGGTLSADLPSGGTYHVVIRHEADAMSTPLDVSLTMSYAGISPTTFYEGVAGLLVGAALIPAGTHLRRKRLAQAASVEERAQTQNVVYFPAAESKLGEDEGRQPPLT